MHDDQLDVELAVLAAAIAARFPQYAHLPLVEAPTDGTVNRVLRLGDDLVVRLPLLPRWADSLDRELRWLPELAPRLPLRIPRPVARGEATTALPLPWAILEWIQGEPWPVGGLGVDEAEHAAAGDLAGFVLALRAIPVPPDAPRTGRRPLAELDEDTRRDLTEAADRIDADRALAVWLDAVAGEPWSGEPTWMHGDLLPGNVLVNGDRGIAAVIDFGGIGVGDPAHDLTAAWSLFGAAGRRAYLAALAPTAHELRRGRGIALHQAAAIIPYYRASNPAFVEVAVATIGRILDDAADAQTTRDPLR